MPSQANLSVFQGDDYSAAVTVTYTTGQPADLTGYTAQAQIRRAVADSASKVDCEIACTIESPIVRLFIHHEQTALLAGDYVWDMQLVSPPPQSFVITIMSGRVRAAQEVTRASALRGLRVTAA